MTVELKLSVVMLGVADVDRAKKFYVEGLGCTVEQEFPGFVRCGLGAGSSSLALYEWDAVAADAGVPAAGTGFRGTSFHFLAASRAEVDEVIRAAIAAGGTVTKAAAATDWGGYDGHFSDPDGHLWKVATAD
ncbi:VOC family protein [Nocardia vulneris]|uniref:VOC family protein n=1 Tax=Nocardia vulneris TaxID=1141657 RepID=UPI0030D43A39